MSWAGKLASRVAIEEPNLIERFPTQWTQITVAIGAMTGTLLAAWLGEKLGRRSAYGLQCIVSIASVLWLYQMHNQYNLSLLFAAFIAGVCTASFYGCCRFIYLSSFQRVFERLAKDSALTLVASWRRSEHCRWHHAETVVGLHDLCRRTRRRARRMQSADLVLCSGNCVDLFCARNQRQTVASVKIDHDRQRL